MTFHMDIIKDCFSTWMHLRILQFLQQQARGLSERQLARLLGFSQATTNRTLHSLAQTGLIKSHKIGRSTTWNFDKQSYLYEMISPILEHLDKIAPPLQYLKDLIVRILKLPRGYRCIVFGSTVSGEDTPSSDIDICIVLPRNTKQPSLTVKRAIDRLQDKCWEKFGRALNPFFINESTLKQQPNKAIHRNILKGLEITR